MWAKSSLSAEFTDTASYIQKRCYQFAVFTTCFAVCVAILGAYTRLTDAGLGCPDWPGCYGQLFLSENLQNYAHINDFNLKKAWTEMAHRYLAGLLGGLILILGICLFYLRNQLFLKAEPRILRLSYALIGLVIFQALLGMWTVTLKLLPLVVMAHLLGGLTMISLLAWMSFSLKPSAISAENRIQRHSAQKAFLPPAQYSLLKYWSAVTLLILILQLFLGGWTSANYAALVCLDFPACYAGQFFPVALDLKQAFNLFAERNPAGITIHMAHRLGALLTAVSLYGLCFYLYFQTSTLRFRRQAVLLIGLLSLQLLLGILNVIALLPLVIAVAHHAVAVLLLLGLLHLHYTVYDPNYSFQQKHSARFSP